MTETRKLAAILVCDVVGFSRMAGADEERLLARLRALRSDVIDPTVAVHKGRVVKRTGDGAIVEFRSAVEAVRCALEIQDAMLERNAGLPEDRRIVFRIGIHVGDVVEESDGDLMGDGVNVAARLEGVCAPGAVCLSEDAYRQVRSRLDLAVSDLGATQLKNIAEPIRIYSLEIGARNGVKRSLQTERIARERSGPAMPDKPSIAVLPFQNMSGDPEQEYFADGMADEIITALSRFPDLLVIARNSTFLYKGGAVDVGQVASDLGVRYVLEGSVRKAGNRVRITGQLVDCATRAHLWADRFEGTLEDIFELQDRVAENVVGELLPSIMKAEIERARRKPPAAIVAYDCFLRAMPMFIAENGAPEAVEIAEEALHLDPKFARAHAMLAHLYEQRYRDRVGNRDDTMAAAERHARAAVAFGWDDGWALTHAGFVLAVPVKDVAAARSALDRAVFLNPSSATALAFRGLVRAITGDPRGGIEDAERALQLSPRDPFGYSSEMAISMAHFDLGNYEAAACHARRALDSNPDFVPGRFGLVLCALARGDSAEAEAGLGWFSERFPISPGVMMSGIADVFPAGSLRAKVLALLQNAGLVVSN